MCICGEHTAVANSVRTELPHYHALAVTAELTEESENASIAQHMDDEKHWQIQTKTVVGETRAESEKHRFTGRRVD